METTCATYPEKVYSEANNYLRHYSSLRFVMFSVYFAIIAAISMAAFGVVDLQPDNNNLIRLLLKIIGLIVTMAFMLFEYRLQQLIRYYQKSARHIEVDLEFKFMLMFRRPRSFFIFAATWLMYSAFLIFWIIGLLI